MSMLILLAALSQAPEAVAPAEQPEKICRESKAPLGSRIRTGRRCKTAEEWAIEDSKKPAMPASVMITNNENDIKAGTVRPQ